MARSTKTTALMTASQKLGELSVRRAQAAQAAAGSRRHRRTAPASTLVGPSADDDNVVDAEVKGSQEGLKAAVADPKPPRQAPVPGACAAFLQPGIYPCLKELLRSPRRPKNASRDEIKGLSQTGDEAPPDQPGDAGKAGRQVRGQGGLRDAVGRAKARADQHGHAGVDPSMRGPGSRRRKLWRFAETFGDILATCSARTAAMGAAAKPVSTGQRPEMPCRDHARAAVDYTDPHPSWEHTATPATAAACKIAPAPDLGTCRRQARCRCAGFLQRCSNRSALPRHRQDHSRPAGPHQEQGKLKNAEDAGSEDSRRHRRRHAHPQHRQWQAGHQRRPPGTCTSRSA